MSERRSALPEEPDPSSESPGSYRQCTGARSLLVIDMNFHNYAMQYLGISITVIQPPTWSPGYPVHLETSIYRIVMVRQDNKTLLNAGRTVTKPCCLLMPGAVLIEKIRKISPVLGYINT